jgi:hypothetical protein
MKVNYSVTLESSDVVEALNNFLATKGVNAAITLEELLNGMNDDLSVEIKTQGDAPVNDKPVKRKRKSPAKKEKEEVTEYPKQVKDEASKDEDALRDQTIKEEANENNEKRLKEEKAKSVDINDLGDDDDTPEPDDDETSKAISTKGDKEGTVPLAKQGIFKKRSKKAA